MNIEDFFTSLKKQIEKDYHVKCSDMLNTYGNEIISYFLHLEKFIYDKDNSNNILILKCNLTFNIDDKFIGYFIIKSIDIEMFTFIMLKDWKFDHNMIDSETLFIDREIHNNSDIMNIYQCINKSLTRIIEGIGIIFNNILRDFTKMVKKLNE